MILDPAALTQADTYKLLIGSVLPRPIAFVTSQDEQGTVNAAPFSFFTVVATVPPMLGIACARKLGGVRKDTARNIAANKQFVVQVVDRAVVEPVNDTAIEFPAEVSEPEMVGLSLVSSKQVAVPRIRECKIHMECRLHQILELGGQDGVPNTDFIIGEVILFHVQDQLYHEGRIDTDALDPVGRLAGTSYICGGERFALPRLSYEAWQKNNASF